MKAAYFAAKMRRNRQVTVPVENLKRLAALTGVPTYELDGCSLQLEIKAIQINNVWKTISSIEEENKR